MIHAIILDIDGVIVGEKIGFNSPDPHHDVIDHLKKISNNGIPVVLSTAKPHFSIRKTIRDANLNNPHITDGGAVLINPVTNEITTQHIIPSQTTQRVVKTMIENGTYTEFYTIDNYFAQQDQQSEITKTHTHILQRKPIMVEDLEAETKHQKITKIMPIAEDKSRRRQVQEVFESLATPLTLHWGTHPVANPRQFGVITAPGISKRQGAIEILRELNISFQNTLGVGDSASDWQFIELCGHAAAIGNASQELKDLVQSKDEQHSFIGPSVDENGIIEILNHFV